MSSRTSPVRRPRHLAQLLTVLHVFSACAAGDEATASSPDEIVAESSPDARTKALLTRTRRVDGRDGDAVLYCERPIDAPHECSPETSVAIAYTTYAGFVASAFDRAFPQYEQLVTQERAALQAASDALSSIIADQDTEKAGLQRRLAELEGITAPLRQEREALESERAGLLARRDVIDVESARIRARLEAPGLPDADRELLTSKLATLKTERDAIERRGPQIAARITAVGAEISDRIDRDAEVERRRASLEQLGTRRVVASTKVADATVRLGEAIGQRDRKVGDALRLIGQNEFVAIDFGDTASRILFEAFRRPAAQFATPASCTLRIQHRPPATPSDSPVLAYTIDADEHAIFPATAKVTRDGDPELEGVSYVETKRLGTLAPGFTGAVQPDRFALEGRWPALASVRVPTGQLRCRNEVIP